MRSIASAIISEPESVGPAGSGEEMEVSSLPVDVPHDGIRQLEGGHLGLRLVVRNHHKPTLDGRQLTRLRLEVISAPGFAKHGNIFRFFIINL